MAGILDCHSFTPLILNGRPLSAAVLEQKDEGGGADPDSAEADENENEEEDGDEEEVTDEV